MRWRIPLLAACFLFAESALGAEFPRTFGEKAVVNESVWKGRKRPARVGRFVVEQYNLHKDVLGKLAAVDMVVFQDPDYDAHWVQKSSEVAKWFVRRGFTQKNVPELEAWLIEKTAADAASGTSVVFAMGVAPTAIVHPPFEDCLLARYAAAGGRVVWLANVPMYVAQGETGPKFIYGQTPQQRMLGLGTNPQTFYGAEGPTITAAGSLWGLEPVNGLVRPVNQQGVTTCFFSDPTNEHCGVGLVNMRHDEPLSGFIFMPDPIDPSQEALLRNAYRLATWSGTPVTIPEPTALLEETMPLTAALRFGENNTRTTFMRDEIVPLYARVDVRAPVPIEAWAEVELKDGQERLADWALPLHVALPEEDVFLGHIDLHELRRDIYQVSVTLHPGTTSVPDLELHPMTLTRDIRVAPLPDHEGTHVAVWVDASPIPKRTMHLLDWLDEHHLEPLFTDDLANGRDLGLWYGMSFSVRRMGNSSHAPAPPGYDSWRRGANGEIMPVLALGNKRVSMGYANPYRRQMEADDFGRQIAFDNAFPAFRRRAVTSDDYSQWFGLDYNAFATEGFRQRFGIDAPRPAMLGDSSDLGQVPPPSPGIVPDDDPWLLLNRYWCEDIHGDTARRLSQAMYDNTDGAGKVGQISGGMQIPVMSASSGQYPPYSMGNKGYSLLSFYYYNRLWQPPLAHVWWLEVARMGNRGSEQWIMPDSGYEGEDASALYDHFGWLMLAGGATGMQYFNIDLKSPGGVEAMTTFGQLSKEYGRLLAKLVPAPKKVALLVPFEQLVYKPTSAYEGVYPFMDLLQAKVDVEPVSPDELNSSNIHQYEAILVVQTNWLQASTAALLTNFAQQGGKLILDAPSSQALNLPGALNLPLKIGGTSIYETSLPSQIAQTKTVLSSIVEPPVDCDDPNITFRRFEAAGVPYLYVNHNLTNAEYLALREANFEDDTLAERMGYGRDVVFARIVRPDDRRIPFDVLAHEVLPTHLHHGRMEFVLPLPKWQGRLVAFLPEVPRKIQLSTPRKAHPGERSPIRIRVMGQGCEIDAFFPLHLQVVDPQGRPNKEYSQRALAADGVATLGIEFAQNDIAGRWTLIVREALTGLQTRAYVDLERRWGWAGKM